MAKNNLTAHMNTALRWFGTRIQRRRGRKGGPPRRFRLAGVEALEQRQLLSTVPVLVTPSGDVTLQADSPLLIPLDGYDSDGLPIGFQVEISNNTAGVTTSFTSESNPSMKITAPGYGVMVFELFEDLAPRITNQIVTLAESGFYDGLIFHRVIDGFMIQGGDPNGDGSGGSTLPDVADQFHVDLQHNRGGVLSMAKSTDDTNNSQFFITETATRHLDFNHSIFGLLIEGDAVREAISGVATKLNDGNPDNDDDADAAKPFTDVVMESVEIYYDNQNAVLMLKAPEGAGGGADVTITIIDHDGSEHPQTPFHVTVVPDATAGLGEYELDPLNANPFLADVEPVYTTVDTAVTFQLAYIDADGALTYIDDEGETVTPPVYFLDEYLQYTYLISDTNVSGDDIQAFSHDDLDYEVNFDTGLVTVTPKNGLVGVHPVSVAVAPWAFSSYYDEYTGEWYYQLWGIDSQLVPIIIQPDDLDPVSKLEMSIVQTPTATDEFGEIEELPENVGWMDEWEPFSVEIWASTVNSDEFGIHTASFDLAYNTDYYTAVEIQYGDMFNTGRTGTIDDANGLVSNVGGTTPMYALTRTPGYYSYDPLNIEKFGDDKRVLVARVNFVPNATGGGVELVPGNGYPQPVQDLGLSIQNAQVGWDVDENTTVELGDVPAVDVWPMLYDNDDSGRVDLGDLAYFAMAFGYEAEQAPCGLGWIMDYDHSGRVDLGDLAYFAVNFHHSAAGADVSLYALGFPEKWILPAAPATSLTMASGDNASGQSPFADDLADEFPDSLNVEARLAFAMAQSSHKSRSDGDCSLQSAIVDLLMRSEVNE